MRGRSRKFVALALVLAGIGLVGGCGDDDPIGPQFGDLVFSPSFVSLPGDDRDTVLVLRNRSSRDLGTILIGVDVDAIIRTPSTVPNSFCTGVQANLVPASISSLAEGAEETVAVFIDLSGVTPSSCAAGKYDANVFAFVNSLGLGAATIRFDWDGTPP